MTNPIADMASNEKDKEKLAGRYTIKAKDKVKFGMIQKSFKQQAPFSFKSQPDITGPFSKPVGESKSQR